MTDTPTETETETKSRRPEASVARDAQVVKLLSERDINRHELDDLLGTTWRVTYGALTRLRTRGLVALKRTGTRTPVWGLTDAGRESVGLEPAPAEVEVTEESGFVTVPA